MTIQDALRQIEQAGGFARAAVLVALVLTAGCASTIKQIPTVTPSGAQGIVAQPYQDETDKLPRLAPPKSYPQGVTGNEGAVINQVVSEGYFRVCERGDLRGCGLFTREVARRLNPNGDGGSWGWLSKSSGEENADGYAVDAMVWTNNPNDLGNVADIIGGAGGSSPRPGFGGFVQRRPSNQWVRPVPLTTAELSYLGVSGGSGGSGGGGTGGGSGGGSGGSGGSTPDYAAALTRIEQALAALAAVQAQQSQRLADLDPVLRATHDYARDGKAAIEVLAARPVTVDFPAYSGSFRILGQNVPVTLRPQR